MDIHELRRLAEADKDKLIRIYNPDTEDFTKQYDDGTGVKEYTLPALEMREFPFHVANHLKRHLAYKIFYKRTEKANPEDDLKEIYKEIEVNVE